MKNSSAMILFLEILKKNLISFLVWASPWFIILYLFWNYHTQISMTYISHNTFFMSIVIVMFIFYLYISALSFIGMYSDILYQYNTKKNKSKIYKPRILQDLPTIGNVLINKLANQKNCTIIAIAICLRDYIIDPHFIHNYPELKCTIPSTNQIIKYPKDSVRSILSFYDIVHSKEDDPYYNFTSAIETCIKSIDIVQ